MTILDTVAKGDRISFTIIRSGIITDTYTGVLVDSSTAGYATARAVTNDINSKHANLFPYFKDAVDNINDPSKYDYLIIKPSDLKEELVAIGIPWINASSVKIAKTSTVKLELYNFEEYKRASLETFLKNAGITYVYSDE